ncbi:MAG: AAA family ATPase [candidate division KSB1 bacterium]|nr:AAA family ATPase [candidate division KSB1 bacterium]MDZ7303199.1 AAA family ATPase [candidate division KSB1 bacterium]MDZ7312189.1 AAA family ATPase [candidate division KSB1 bacterium]
MSEPDNSDLAMEENKTNRDRVRVITVAGGKGGIGKTMICASLGIALAESGSRVTLVDADLGGANLHTVVGMYMPGKTIYDFLTRKAKTLGELALETTIEGLSLISGAAGIVGLANIEYWEKLKMIRHLRKLDADFVVVDIGAGMSLNEIDLFNAGDIPIVVANPEPTSIQECYNFLKVAIFRRLRREFANSYLVQELLDHCKDPSHANDRRLLAEIGDEVLRRDRREGVRFFKTVNEFTPKLILNRIFDYQETRDGLALQIAAQDLLQVRLEYWGYMSYDPAIPQAIRDMRPQDLLAPESANRQRFLMIVRKYLLGEKIRYHSPGTRVILPIIKKLSGANGEGRICCTLCPLWDRCVLQEGGLPCRMPEEEFKEKLTRLGTAASKPQAAPMSVHL